ncbi:tRNA lysidine(34) synthetase TilS [Corynebacterium sp.]|uniref:tRNA lysidine(34) synthetase TilS n=1 Tax=Corynebacterium sp. TaxID=1720 RepID=UPI0026DC5358|nr:tRNA lysidine(34) synthetase TilS [Corynebacterium sp.]MDO5076863.1 tRNA lysidine(34) synthetase TilS [Corynebacterium sp.]
MTAPFWPRVSPAFLRVRVAVREFAAGPVIVGVSGGPDSLALIAAARAEGVAAHAVIVDHALQPHSADVAARAAECVHRCGASATIVRIDVPTTGESIEAAARRARYEALEQAAAGRDIWVGHTMDDQAETLLLGALRGRATGMQPRRGAIVRPLLQVRRADTIAACDELGFDYWRDPHNEDTRFRRVAVRTQVLPLLSDILGGDCVPALAQAGADVAGAHAYLRDGIQVGDTLDIAELEVHPARRRQIIATWLQHHNAQVTGATISAIERLVTHWHGQGEVLVGAQGLAVRRRGGILSVSHSTRDR